MAEPTALKRSSVLELPVTDVVVTGLGKTGEMPKQNTVNAWISMAWKPYTEQVFDRPLGVRDRA